MLRGYGAEVVITPTAVEHDSPESYYSVSSRLAEEIPGGFKPDQYSNMSNPEAHYRDHRAGDPASRPAATSTRSSSPSAPAARSAASAATSRRTRPTCRSSASTPKGRSTRRRATATSTRTSSKGSARTRGRRRWTRTSSTSGSASPIATRSSPRAASRARRACSSAARRARRSPARSSTRRLGPDARVLTILPDSGRSYLSKFLDDNWMIEHGFLERSAPAPTVRELLRSKRANAGARHDLGAPEGGRGDRGDGAVLDLAAARWCATVSSSLSDVIGSLQDRALLDLVIPLALSLAGAAALADGLKNLQVLPKTTSKDEVKQIHEGAGQGARRRVRFCHDVPDMASDKNEKKLIARQDDADDRTRSTTSGSRG